MRNKFNWLTVVTSSVYKKTSLNPVVQIKKRCYNMHAMMISSKYPVKVTKTYMPNFLTLLSLFTCIDNSLNPVIKILYKDTARCYTSSLQNFKIVLLFGK